MQTLEIRFLGEGAIQYGGEAVYLPYAKAAEVFFVLLHERQIGRLRLCDLVWDLEECEEEKAKRNLRHAIYTIRKQTDDALIQSPRRETVLISEDCTVRSDLDILLGYDPAHGDEGAVREFLSCYGGPFLLSFRSSSVKLEEWIEANAQSYHRMYVDKLRQTIERLSLAGEHDLAEACCRRLLALEEYDEPCCVALMELYQKTGRYAEAIAVYQELETRLEAELWVRPLPETTEVYRSVKRSLLQEKKQDVTHSLYGRNAELELLGDQLRQLVQGQPFRHCVIAGEAGIGKTALMQGFLRGDSADCLVLELCCYELEESFVLRLWDRALEKIATFLVEKGYRLPAQLAGDIARVFPTFHAWHEPDGERGRGRKGSAKDIDRNLCEMFRFLWERYGVRTLVAIDDLQWADGDSLSILNKVLFANRETMLLVASQREEELEKLKQFHYHLRRFSEIEDIALTRFSEDRTRQFIRQTHPEMLERAGEIYRYSEGNPLFLTEMMKNIRDNISVGSITDKMARLVEGRVLRLGGNAQKLMSICSMFYDELSVQTLAELVEFGEGLLMDAVEELVRKSILRETVTADGALQLSFSHAIIRKYVYDAMPRAKRVIMHGRIGNLLEGGLCGIPLDRVTYPKLIYHYERAENKVKLFEYKLKQMQLTFNVCHELFPVLELGQEEGLFDEYSNERVLRAEFKRLKSIYNEIRTLDTPYIRELQILFLYLYGRFSNGSGNLPVAHEALTALMELAGDDPHYLQYSFRGAIQLIQYAINSNDLELMLQSANRALVLAERTGDLSQSGLAYRHLGYYYILKGEYAQGEETLRRARALFEGLNDPQKYRLHIAATYFFAGEGMCRQGDLAQALELYTKTLELCDVEVNFTSTAVLYLRFGYIYYQMGEMERAKGFLEQSIRAYERIIFIWGRADAYYYLHKVCEAKNQPGAAKKYLEKAEGIMASHDFRLSI